MPRLWLTILLLLSLTFLGWMTQAKAKPINSIRLMLSPYARYRKWIEAMAKHESGNYQNTLTKEANNIFSMGYPSQRPAVNTGSYILANAGQDEPVFSQYKSFDQAIQDLLLWFKYTKFPTNIATVESFTEALKDRDYFRQDKTAYLAGVKSNIA